jgi:hypothetical protein
MIKTIEAPVLIDPATGKLDAGRLRQLCLDLGAEDAGLVELEGPALADQRDDILWFFPVYVVAGSDAEGHVARRFPRKRTKQVSETWLALGGEPRVTRNSLHATTLCRTP